MLLAVAPAQAAGVPAWGRAHLVAGPLNTGHYGTADTISCARPGQCALGGYVDQVQGGEPQQAYVDSESHGHWAKAQVVAATLNVGGDADVDAISCGAPGDCVAGGLYTSVTKGDHDQLPFIVIEKTGRWGHAREVAAALNNSGGEGGGVDSVSCPLATTCAVVGSVSHMVGSSGTIQGFVLFEHDGRWGTPHLVAASFNTGGRAYATSVSCLRSGSCTAVGTYVTASGYGDFAVSESDGRWGHAVQIASSLPGSDRKGLGTVSCGGPGSCTAGGYYYGPGYRPYVVDETAGHWGAAKVLAANLNTNLEGEVYSVSCWAPGDCLAGGSVAGLNGLSEAFLDTESRGTGRPPALLGGSLTVGDGVTAGVNQVSCPAAGSCGVAGTYTNSADDEESFVQAQVHGHRHDAQQVAGTTSTGEKGYPGAQAVSCTAGGYCAAAGLEQTGTSGIDATKPYAVALPGLLVLRISTLRTTRAGKKLHIPVSGLVPGAAVRLRLHSGSTTRTVTRTSRSTTFSVVLPRAGHWTVEATARETDCLVDPASKTVRAT